MVNLFSEGSRVVVLKASYHLHSANFLIDVRLGVKQEGKSHLKLKLSAYRESGKSAGRMGVGIKREALLQLEYIHLNILCS